MNNLFSSASGNPDLNEQRNINFEGGMNCRPSPEVEIDLSGFYNDVRDLIDRASRNDPYLNISKAVFAGCEADIKVSIWKYLRGRLSHTYLYARDKNPEALGRSGEELSYVPTHKTDLELGFTSPFGLSGSLFGSFNGKRYYYDSGNNQQALGSYFLWNLKVSQKLLEHWKASVSLENIFDRDYEEEEGYPQPGRSFLFSLTGRF